jgi:hypothetical protein
MKISLALFELSRFDRQIDIHGEVYVRISASLGMTLFLNEVGLFQLGVSNRIRMRGVGVFRNTYVVY